MHSSETGSERLATTLIVGLVGDAELFVGADTAVTTDRDAVLPSRKLDYRTDPPIAWGFSGNEEWDTSFILLGSGLLGLGMFFWLSSSGAAGGLSGSTAAPLVCGARKCRQPKRERAKCGRLGHRRGRTERVLHPIDRP